MRSYGLLEILDFCCILYFVLTTITVYGSLLMLASTVYDTNSSYVIVFASYVVFNVFANFYFCRSYKPFLGCIESTNLPGNLWTFCKDCQIMQPPRCHHCILCRRCVVKRDHHCFFIGICIGARNQGYFAMYCFHCFIGVFIGFMTISSHLSNTYYEVFSLDFYKYFPPLTVYSWILGYVDIETLFYTCLLSASAVTGIFVAVMFLLQMILITCDMTSYELSLSSSHYKFNIKQFRPLYNINKVLGPCWMCNFIVPIPYKGLVYDVSKQSF